MKFRKISWEYPSQSIEQSQQAYLSGRTGLLIGLEFRFEVMVEGVVIKLALYSYVFCVGGWLVMALLS